MSERTERVGGEESIERTNEECIQDEEIRYANYAKARMIGWLIVNDGRLVFEPKEEM